MPTNAINDTGVKYLYDKLHGEIEPIAEAVSDREVTIEGNPLNFNTLSSQTAKSTILSVEPIQDLHGFTKPWVGGAGKNKLQLNASGTDSNRGMTYTINQDDGSVSVYGSYTGTAFLGATVGSITLSAGSYIFNGQNNVDSTRKLLTLQLYDPSVPVQLVNRDTNADFSFTLEEEKTLEIKVGFRAGCTVPESTPAVMTPMIRLATETDPTFAKYENICPISGRSEIGILGCGKNLFDKDSRILDYYLDENGNEVSFSGWNISDYIMLDNSITYLGVTNPGNAPRSCWYDEHKNFISSFKPLAARTTLNVPLNAKYVRFSLLGNDIYTFAVYDGEDISTPYEPYTKSTDLTISLGQTVYGGTLDVENGVLVVDKESIILNGNETWTKSSNPNIHQGRAGYFLGGTILSRCVYSGSDYNINNVVIKYNCDEENGKSAMQAASSDVFTIGIGQTENTYTNLWINVDATDCPNATAFKSWLASNPIQCVYPLRDEYKTTINLTPHTINLLKGVNNISTDGDKITLTYRDGSIATLGDLTSAVDSLDSKIDESKILTDTVTGDKYILVVTNGVLDIQQISN